MTFIELDQDIELEDGEWITATVMNIVPSGIGEWTGTIDIDGETVYVTGTCDQSDFPLTWQVERFIR